MLLETVIKVSIIAAVALSGAVLFRRRSAALRHWILACAVAGAMLVPLLAGLVPTSPVPMDRVAAALGSAPATVRPARTAEATAGGIAEPPRPRLTGLARSAVVLWLTGAGLGLFALGAGLVRLAWLTSQAQPVGNVRLVTIARNLSAGLKLHRPVRLLQSRHPALPLTWGLSRPDILLPEGADAWDEERIRVVLLHELAHVRRADWATQLLAEGLRAVYWFNPLVWRLSRRMREESEHACDDVVLSSGIEASAYAAHLLDLARARSHRRTVSLPAPAMAQPSSFERRFRAMLNVTRDRTAITSLSRIMATGAVVALSFLVAGLSAAQTFSSFSGSVFDATSRVVPSITVTLVNPATSALHQVRSDPAGRFEFVGLPPGEYQFEATGPGFAPLTGSVLVSGSSVQHDLVLQVGSLQETITIEASQSEVPPPASAPTRRNPPRADLADSAVTCQPSATGGQIRPPRKLVHERPTYPEGPRVSGVGGIVLLAARIGVDGTIAAVGVRESPHPDLTLAALEAVGQWEFSQTLLNCQPIEVDMVVTANFVVQP